MAGLHGDDAAGRLAAVPLFEGLSKKALRQIAGMTKEQRFAEGDEVTIESTRGARFHLVLEGRLTVRRGGKEVAQLGPGDTVGEMALLDDGLRTATVVALEPTTTLTMAAWNFRSLLRSEPAIMEKILLQLVARLRAAEGTPAV